RATIDLAKAADVLPTSNRDQVRAELKKLIAQTGLGSIPVEVWIDAHKAVRRLTMDLSTTASGQQLSVRFEVELFGFGPTPPVTAPSDSEVFDATKTALGGLGSASAWGASSRKRRRACLPPEASGSPWASSSTSKSRSSNRR